jgi:hypothetical protein
MDPHSEQELLTAISNKDVGKYEALIQNASAINNSVLLTVIVLSGNVDAFRALLKHSSVNPFYDDNYLIHMLINHNLPTDLLAAILEHPANHLTADHYHAFHSACGRSKDKQDLLQSYLNKQ